MRRLPLGKRGDSFLERVSRGLQVILRHRAPAHGIHTDPGGWASLEALLALPVLRAAGVNRSHVDALGEDPALEAGRRFQFKQDPPGHTLIRAIQGHSMPHIDPQALGRPARLSDVPGELLVHMAPRDAWYAGHLADGLLPGIMTGRSQRGLVYLGTDVARKECKLKNSQDKILIRVSARDMRDRGLRFFLSARGDVLCSDPVPASCFESAMGWTRGAIKVLWIPSDGPPPGGSAGLPGMERTRSTAPSSRGPAASPAPRPRRPWVRTGTPGGPAQHASDPAPGHAGGAIWQPTQTSATAALVSRGRSRSRHGASRCPPLRGVSQRSTGARGAPAMTVSSDSPRPSPLRSGPARSPASMDRALWAARAPVWAPCPAAANRPSAPTGGQNVPDPVLAAYLDPAGSQRREPCITPGPGALPPPAMLQWGDIRYVRVYDDPPDRAMVGDLGGLVGTRMLPPSWRPGARVPRTPSRRRIR